MLTQIVEADRPSLGRAASWVASGGVGAISVVIPMDAVLAVRSSAQMSRDGISDDYEGYRQKGRETRTWPVCRRAAEMAELDELLAQLGDDEEQQRDLAGHTTRWSFGLVYVSIWSDVPAPRPSQQDLSGLNGLHPHHRSVNR